MSEEANGKHVIIRFDAGKCIHSRHCVLDRPDVFVPNVQGEWIHPDAATADEVAELAHNCPSGAITYERIDGGAQEQPPIVNTVRVRENGPYGFHGDLAIETTGGPTRTLRATLCRCGQSANKPYCDGAHAGAGFTATGDPPSRTSTVLAARNGPVTIRPTKNGPLKITGNLEVVCGTGRTIARVGFADPRSGAEGGAESIDMLTKTALCRCGQSKTKPFCDGSHAIAGFVADGG